MQTLSDNCQSVPPTPPKDAKNLQKRELTTRQTKLKHIYKVEDKSKSPQIDLQSI